MTTMATANVVNEVDYLLTHPFSLMSFEEKNEIKRLGAHRPKDVQIKQKDTRQNRSFGVSWFERKDWLTASVARSALFCFPCVLFGGDTAWTQQGVVDLKHVSCKIKKHECSSSHIGNCVKLSMLGKVNIACQLDDGHRISVQRHNEQVKKNRHSLSRIVDCIRFCGAHELALRLATADAAARPRRTQSSDNVSVAAQCCDIMIEQSQARFQKARHLVSFELIDPKLFPQFKTSFPQKQLDIACEHFPMICKEKLHGELVVMYSSAEFVGLTSAMSLLRMFTENNLQGTFSETLKLTQIAMTTPVTSAESERCFSTLKRIKTFLRSTMGQDRLNALAMLSIERDLIQKSPDFNDMVINLFASQKGRRCELLFK